MKWLTWLAAFAAGAVLGAVAVPIVGDLRDQLTPAKRLACSPRSAICVGKPLRSIDVNRAETGQIFLDESYDGERRYLSDLIEEVAKRERVILRFERGKRITRVSVENGRIVAVLEEPDVTYP